MLLPAKVSSFDFVLRWEKVKNSNLILNFKPVVDKAFEQGFIKKLENTAFLHWQARPRNLRQWGLLYFDGKGTSVYLSSIAENISYQPSTLEHSLIDVNERAVKAIPTAVIAYRNVKVEVAEQGKIIIGEAA